MSNFEFFRTEWPELDQTAQRGEEYVQSDPRSAVFYARRALEQAVIDNPVTLLSIIK